MTGAPEVSEHDGAIGELPIEQRMPESQYQARDPGPRSRITERQLPHIERIRSKTRASIRAVARHHALQVSANASELIKRLHH